MLDQDIDEVITILNQAVRQWQTPAVTIVAMREGDPFKVLISCILSLRTQDRTTGAASQRLFAVAATPDEMLRLTVEDLAAVIYPVGFYRTKARQILDICRELQDRHHGRVPASLDELLTLKGVGRKTANLVVTLGFGGQGICVDTHVHRICNRWGYVSTATAEQTEFALRRKLPDRYWPVINDLLVTFGQNLCTPLSPHCSRCPMAHICDRVSVGRSR